VKGTHVLSFVNKNLSILNFQLGLQWRNYRGQRGQLPQAQQARGRNVRRFLVRGVIGVSRIFDWGWGSCKFSSLTSFTLDDISHS